MSLEISERAFEDASECGLLQGGPGACPGDTATAREASIPFGDAAPGGYRKRLYSDYDRTLGLLPRDVVDFVLATQPREWERLAQHHGTAVKERFLQLLAVEIERRGVLDVLRQGINDCRLQIQARVRPSRERAQRRDEAPPPNIGTGGDVTEHERTPTEGMRAS